MASSLVELASTEQTPYDAVLLADVIESAYDLLADRALAGGLHVPRPHAQRIVGESGVCDEASDAVTRAAQKLGLAAMREFHEDGIHYITSLSPIDQLPDENDMILCMTWGQFSPDGFSAMRTGFVGRRREIAALIDPADYQDAYSPESVTYRQITHTPSVIPSAEHVWLKTTPEDLLYKRYPVGEVPADNFAPEEWQFPHLIQGSRN